MEPFYVLMRLPGEPAEDFQMIIPFTPRNRDNMIGWMAAKSDPGDYGKRVVYQFPKQKVILGPEAGQRAHQPGRDDLATALAVEPARKPGDLRQHAGHPARGVDRLHPAAVPAGRADGDTRAHARAWSSTRTRSRWHPDLETALLQVFGEQPAEEPTGGAGVRVLRPEAATARLVPAGD